METAPLSDTIPTELASQQRQFLRFMRDPSSELPTGSNPRAMAIYAELVYRNIAGFISQFFPVCKQVCTDAAWEALIRDFIAHHPSQTPYFLAIAEEFLQFLLTKPASLNGLPEYLTELAHYEWVELALDVADIPQPQVAQNRDAGWDGRWRLSPLAWVLAYQYPVHLIGANNTNPEPTPSAYVVYRNRELDVKFIALTLASAQWLQAINPDTTPRQALEHLLNGAITPAIEEQTAPILNNWLELEILIPA